MDHPKIDSLADERSRFTGRRRIAQSLQRGRCRDTDARRFVVADVVGFRSNRGGLTEEHVIGEGTGPAAKHFVTNLKFGHVTADRLDRPREIDAQATLGRSADASH